MRKSFSKSFQRNPSQLVFESAPLAPDSDDEFNDMPVPGPSKKARGRPKKDALQSPRKGQRKSDARRKTLLGPSLKRAPSTRVVDPQLPNPLVELLGSDIEFDNIESSGEDVPVEEDQSDDPEDEVIESDDSVATSRDDARSSQTHFTPPAWKGEGRSSWQLDYSGSESKGKKKQQPIDNSDTETESEHDLPPLPTSTTAQKRKLPPSPAGSAKRMRRSSEPSNRSPPASNEDDSATEEEEYEESFLTTTAINSLHIPSQPAPTTYTDPNTATQSETEEETDEEFSLEGAKPTLTPRDDQIPAGPLVLDAKKAIRVPASVNRFLRTYQRDGVKFFYDRWKEGRGGILGRSISTILQRCL
eukprot:GHVU01022525.1.p1 GENE.GHVU01022525.1~~GHVU01022525.1.p1  ORF type:complete len:359 (+),score=37.57 GHVU01022525.1:30-1106(+)